MLLPAAVGGITLALVFGLLSFAGLLGFGDTKLLTSIGVCVGHPLSLQIAVCVLASGGVVALFHMLRRRSGRAVVSNLAKPQELGRERVDDLRGPKSICSAMRSRSRWACCGAGGRVRALALAAVGCRAQPRSARRSAESRIVSSSSG